MVDNNLNPTRSPHPSLSSPNESPTTERRRCVYLIALIYIVFNFPKEALFIIHWKQVSVCWQGSVHLVFLLRLRLVPSCLAQQKGTRYTEPCDLIGRTPFICLSPCLRHHQKYLSELASKPTYRSEFSSPPSNSKPSRRASCFDDDGYRSLPKRDVNAMKH